MKFLCLECDKNEVDDPQIHFCDECEKKLDPSPVWIGAAIFALVVFFVVFYVCAFAAFEAISKYLIK